ncbi:putative ATP-dependent DNA helicase [Alternaria arborescens]|nr:putative ATP-dependent DNA helicase [Alternaria arborescens]
MGDRYHLSNHPQRLGAPRRASQYDALRPQYRQPERQIALRDRYRATQHERPIYDVVEDDDDLYDHGPQLDSFDNRLLQQPVPNRQQQAVLGRTRLSFAPGQSTFISNAAPSQPQQPFHAHRNTTYDDDEGTFNTGPKNAATDREAEYHLRPKKIVQGQLSRFVHNPAPFPETSSDVPLGRSSSPAFKASQRCAKQVIPTTPQREAEPQLFEDKFQSPDEDYRQQYQHPCKQHVQNGLRPREDVDLQYLQHRLPKPQPNPLHLSHAPPTCQGIRLVPVATLPSRLRTVFPYPTFNAVQSKCFERVFNTDDNFVLASPTGSGKTVILELAVCRAVATNATGQYKVVYQAPTKALCSERQRDWEAKFNQLGLKCAQLTGDSDAGDLRNVQSANIIITTPEKWDSMTRKWKDHEKLMRLIRVFLIDEVHILREDRGATLEAVVSRMKSIGTGVRFVALSATVPNLNDIAAWLGKNFSALDTPAANEKFGEEFRPVKLQKYVRGYNTSSTNDFGFEKVLDARIPEVIASYCKRKPIMVFCATRNSTANTAKLIAKWWDSSSGRNRMWEPPSKLPALSNKELLEIVASGVAFHHAGLDLDDRMQVEKGFIAGEINVICCTSTLAVGVNLPCHLVIIKNTMSWGAEGLQEYSDLEMMQMLGRAGRPQYDDSAVAVIMTRQAKVRRYEKLVTGQDLIESKLHLNLVDHMNAEIGLGTISDLQSARKWLRGTFLYVRLQQNPNFYKLDGSRSGQSIEEQVDDICFRDITLLRETNLISGEEYFRSTEFGQAMARYYVNFHTMKTFMGLGSKSTPSEILSAMAQATEFSTIRFRQGEKSFYKLLNKSRSIRWPIPVNLDLPAQKVSLIIQSVLGSAVISWDGEAGKHRSQYVTETHIIFKNISSLVRCIIDCQIILTDSVSIHSALMLERSLGARIWDDSPLQMKQIDTIGVIAVRKLVNAGLRSIEDLEGCEPHRIEALVGRNPPYGLTILDMVRSFPKLRVSLHAQPATVITSHDGVRIQIKADIGFINEQPPRRFNDKLIYVCLLVDTSDGRKIHFARIRPCRKPTATSEDFGDGDLDDDTLVGASLCGFDFDQIENYADPIATVSQRNTEKSKPAKTKDTGKSKNATQPLDAAPGDKYEEPVQLANGKWACNHACKDRLACKHLCCKDGMDKPPKKKATVKRVPSGEDRPEPTQKAPVSKGKQTQTKLQLTASKRKVSASIDELDLTQQEKKQKANFGINGPRDYRGLHQLHKTVQGKELPTSLNSVMYKKPTYCYSQGGEHGLDFMSSTVERPPTSSDYGDFLSDAQEYEDFMGNEAAEPMCESDTFGDDNSMVEDAMIGLADSRDLQAVRESEGDIMRSFENALDDADGMRYGQDGNPMDVSLGDRNDRGKIVPVNHDESHKACVGESPLLFVGDTSSPQVEIADIFDMLDEKLAKDSSVDEKPVLEAFKDLEPWIFQEFGDIVELVDE